MYKIEITVNGGGEFIQKVLEAVLLYVLEFLKTAGLEVQGIVYKEEDK